MALTVYQARDLAIVADTSKRMVVLLEQILAELKKPASNKQTPITVKKTPGLSLGVLSDIN